MKIVKSFEDKGYFDDRFSSTRETWRWGLGDDGNLYYQYDGGPHSDEWCWFFDPDERWSLSIQDMKRIVKEFGHLLVWL